MHRNKKKRIIVMKQWSVYASVLHNSKLNFERMIRMRKKCDIIDEELWFIKKKKKKQTKKGV